MSEVDIMNQAREHASEFQIIQKPVFCNGEHGVEYQINISDSALQRLANISPGVTGHTLPYAGNPKHLNAKLNDQIRLTFLKITSPCPPKIYLPDPIGRPVGAPVSLAASIPPLFPRPAKPVRVNTPVTYGRYANDPRKLHVAERRDSLQGPAARATPTVSARDPLSLLRASFVDSTVPVYTSAGTTLPTYTTLASPIHADHLSKI